MNVLCSTQPNSFDELYEIAKHTVFDYDRKWSDGKGFHPFAIYGINSPSMLPGTTAISMTPGNRRMVFIGTSNGNVLLYERYCKDERRKKGNGVTIDCGLSNEIKLGIKNHHLIESDQFRDVLKKIWLKIEAGN